MTKESCSSRLQQALKIRNMKQADLSQLTNIPKSAISQYLSGKFEPKQDRLEIIARVLNVSEAWLMGYDVPYDRNAVSSVHNFTPSIIEGYTTFPVIDKVIMVTTNEQMQQIAQRLQTAMQRSGLSYGDIATITNIPKSAVHRYISGETPKIPLERLEKISKALSISAAWAMGWDDEDNQKSNNKSNVVEYFTLHEKNLINAYRSKPEMQSAVDTLLGITNEKSEKSPTRAMKIAAYGGGIIDHKITATNEEIMQAIEESEDNQFVIKKQDL